MKNCKLFILLIFISVNLFSQSASNSVQYLKLDSIQYYDEAIALVDNYIFERCRLDLYYPTNIDNFSTVVWFHGGGLKSGEKFIPNELKEQNIAVVSVNYRLFPKVFSPKYIEDAAAAVAWTFNNIAEFGGDTSKIFVSGHSAGGYLTSMIGFDKKWLKRFKINADRIAGLIPFSGHTITHFTIREERGIPGEQPIIDSLAPLYHVRNDSSPTVLITGDRNFELLGRYEENAYFYRMLKVVGHNHVYLYELQGFDHGSMVDPAFKILLKFINSKQW